MLLAASSLGCGQGARSHGDGPDAQFRRVVTAYLDSIAGAGFSGTVLIARDSTVLLHRAYGRGGASRDTTVSYWVASMTKPVAAATALSLVDEGRWSLDDSLGGLLPRVPADKRAITLRQLLSHTSWLDNSHASEGMTDRDAALEALLATSLAEPGDRPYLYSDDAFALVAILAERVSGIPYVELARSRVLLPAGMSHTGWVGEPAQRQVVPPLDPVAAQLGNPHFFRDGEPVGSWGWRGSSGLFATVGDLYRLLRFLHDDPAGRRMGAQMARPAVIARRDGDRVVAHGFGMVFDSAANRPTEVRHTGAEDFLGHTGVMRRRGDEYVIVLSDAGVDETTEREWGPAVGADLAEMLGWH